MTDCAADTGHGVTAIVRWLSTVLTDSEWQQLVNMIDLADRERQQTEKPVQNGSD